MTIDYKALLYLFFALMLSTGTYANSIDVGFTDMDGQKHQLSDYRGKWVVVNYWATWCPPCRKEIPELSDFHLQYDDAVVIGVNYEPDMSDEALKAFSVRYQMSYPVTRVSKEFSKALGTPVGLPTTVIVNPEGRIIKTVAGIVTEESLNNIISRHSN